MEVEECEYDSRNRFAEICHNCVEFPNNSGVPLKNLAVQFRSTGRDSVSKAVKYVQVEKHACIEPINCVEVVPQLRSSEARGFLRDSARARKVWAKLT